MVGDQFSEKLLMMRFDTASAIYAEFGPFYTGMVAELSTVLEQVGLA